MTLCDQCIKSVNQHTDCNDEGSRLENGIIIECPQFKKTDPVNHIKERYKMHELEGSVRSRLEYFTEFIVDIAVYETEMAEEIAADIIEVITMMDMRKTFEYIEDRQNLKKYITSVNFLDKLRWISWGTSIRGAWVDWPVKLENEEITINKEEFYKILEWIAEEERQTADQYVAIGKKKYNLSKSKRIIRFNSHIMGPIETIYKTEKGNYFKSIQRMMQPIIWRLMTEEMAKEQMLVYDVQAYEKEFEELEEA